VKHGLRRADQEEAGDDERRNGCDLEHHQHALEASAGFDPEAIYCGEYSQRDDNDPVFGTGQASEFEEVAGKGDGDRGHATGLNNKKQGPSIQESEDGMERLAEIFVLAADLGNAGSELRVDERAEYNDDAAGDPDREDEYGRVQVLGDDVRIHKDAGADDAAHDHHGRVEEAKLRCKSRAVVALDVQWRLEHDEQY